MGPVEPGARQQLHRAAVEPRMHAVAVVFDFVQPVRPVRGHVDAAGSSPAAQAEQRHPGWLRGAAMPEGCRHALAARTRR